MGRPSAELFVHTKVTTLRKTAAKRLYLRSRHQAATSSIGDGITVKGPFRLKLLYYLVMKPRTPTELASLERKHLSDISRGLGKLRKDGLVEYRSSGTRERYYRPTQEGYVLLYASMRQGR